MDSISYPYLSIGCLFRRSPQIPLFYRLINVIFKFQGERVIEVPFALGFINQRHHNRLLEIGNVLNYYGQITKHDVIDKYETIGDCTNVDVLEYVPKEKYDIVVSISTMEHVGFDETPVDKEKTEKAMLRLFDFIKPDGRILVTVPIGYNPYIDEFIKSHYELFTHIYFLHKDRSRWGWIQGKINENLNNKSSLTAFLIYEPHDYSKSQK